jgi:pimeloyl-ACP methyl ester carboxylesterase
VPRVESFEVHVPDEAIDDLRARLRRTRWTDAVAGSGWERGTDREVLRELVRYWEEGFDWRAQEAAINRVPQFRAVVDGVGIHFVRVPGRGPSCLPLVLTHGWPGSFLEMAKVIAPLSDPAGHGGEDRDAFDVIVPSLPGYGFSDVPAAPGMSAARIADLWLGLMDALGYPRFALQGGDWGASVSTWLALRRPDRVAGLHLNYVPGSYRPHVDEAAEPLTSAEREFLIAKEHWGREEGAYGHIQATRPQTLAFALHDSPVGLAAWILEKFRSWSDCGGDVLARFTRDELLANVSLYWFTGTIHSSMRLYYESAKTPLALAPGERVRVPTAVARFALEAPMPPREWVARGYDVVRWTELPRGAHFAAMEEPAAFVDDVRASFRERRG